MMAQKTKRLTPVEIEAQVKQAALTLIMPDLRRLKSRAVQCISDACDPNKRRLMTTTTVKTNAAGEVMTTFSVTSLPPSQGAAKALIRIVDEIYNRLAS